MTSCRNCGLEWESLAQAHCDSCCRQFGGEESFDGHRTRGLCHKFLGGFEKDGVVYSAGEMNRARKAKTASEGKKK